MVTNSTVEFELLLSSFKKLLQECKIYTGRIIVLNINEWKSNSLGEIINIGD